MGTLTNAAVEKGIAGTDVTTVICRSNVRHTLTHKAKGHFDTGPIPARGGVRWFRAPQGVGKFPFGCKFHVEMSGTSTVRRAAS